MNTELLYKLATSHINLFCSIQIILIILLSIFSFAKIRKLFIGINKKTWLALILLFLLGFFLRSQSLSRVNYTAILEYADNARTGIYNGQFGKCDAWNQTSCVVLEELEHTWGYPFLLSAVFRVFGDKLANAIVFSCLINSLTIIVIFLIGYLLFKDSLLSLVSSFILMITPMERFLAGTTDVDPISEFFIAFSILAFLISIEIDTKDVWALFMLILSYTLTIKHDNIVLLIFFPISLVLLGYQMHFSRIKNLFIPIAIFILASLPIFMFIFDHTMKGYYFNDGGLLHMQSFSLDYFLPNLVGYFANYFANGYFVPLFSVLFVSGLLVLPYNNRKYLFLRLLFLANFLPVAFHFQYSFRFLPVRYMFQWNIAYSLVAATFLMEILNFLSHELRITTYGTQILKVFKSALVVCIVVYILSVSNIDFHLPKEEKYKFRDENFLNALNNISAECWVVHDLGTTWTAFKELYGDTHKVIIPTYYIYSTYLGEGDFLEGKANCVRYLRQRGDSSANASFVLQHFDTTYLYNISNFDIYEVRMNKKRFL